MEKEEFDYVETGQTIIDNIKDALESLFELSTDNLDYETPMLFKVTTLSKDMDELFSNFNETKTYHYATNITDNLLLIKKISDDILSISDYMKNTPHNLFSKNYTNAQKVLEESKEDICYCICKRYEFCASKKSGLRKKHDEDFKNDVLNQFGIHDNLDTFLEKKEDIVIEEFIDSEEEAGLIYENFTDSEEEIKPIVGDFYELLQQNAQNFLDIFNRESEKQKSEKKEKKQKSGK